MLQTSRKPYDSVMMEVLNSILVEFCIPMKLVRLTEIHSEFCVDKYLSEVVLFRMVSNKVMPNYHCFKTVFLNLV
jgi:hypothetical protein